MSSSVIYLTFIYKCNISADKAITNNLIENQEAIYVKLGVLRVIHKYLEGISTSFHE